MPWRSWPSIRMPWDSDPKALGSAPVAEVFLAGLRGLLRGVRLRLDLLPVGAQPAADRLQWPEMASRAKAKSRGEGDKLVRSLETLAGPESGLMHKQFIREHIDARWC